MAKSEKWGLALLAVALLGLAALLLWTAWGGARTAAEGLRDLPAITAPDLPLPNTPDGPRLPDAPIPRPR